MIASIASEGGLLSQIGSWDTAAFLFVNRLNSPAWDALMRQVSSPWVLVPVHLLVLLGLLWRAGWRARGAVMALLALVVAVDLGGVQLIKLAAQRLRPSWQEDLAGAVHLVDGYRGGAYGFVSTHTAYAFALATCALFLLHRRPLVLAVFAWAVAVGYSRIYLGLHYPGDVVGGALWGVAVVVGLRWGAGLFMRSRIGAGLAGTVASDIPDAFAKTTTGPQPSSVA